MKVRQYISKSRKYKSANLLCRALFNTTSTILLAWFAPPIKDCTAAAMLLASFGLLKALNCISFELPKGKTPH